MRVRFGQDLATGLLFLFIGIGAILTIYFYDHMSMGTPNRPGTGVLPLALSWCLIGTGTLLAIKSLLSGDSEITGINWRPLILVTAGVTVFGLAIDLLGLFLTMTLSMSICAAAMTETRWGEYAVFLAIMIVSSWAMFVCFLGMPINACPAAVPCDLCWIVKTPIKAAYDALMMVVR